MPTLIFVIAAIAVIFFAASVLVAWLSARSRIAGKYHAGRLRPDEIDGKLRGLRTLQCFLWIAIIVICLAGCAIMQFLNEDIITQGGFWNDFLYEPFNGLDWPLNWVFAVLYLLITAACFIAVWVGARLGMRWAAKGFLLTRILPNIVGRRKSLA